MSKAGDFVKKVEDEIESIFTGGRRAQDDHENSQEENHCDFFLESENLAMPEVHLGRAEHEEQAHLLAEENHKKKHPHFSDDGKSAGKTEKNQADKLTVNFGTLAVPEIHVSHK